MKNESPHRFAELAPIELSRCISAVPALILPVGTLEYHGDHLPLGLDGLKAEAIAERAAVVSGGVLAPTTWWAADGVAGSYSLRLGGDVLAPLLVEALTQFSDMGFRAIVLVNGHFGLENSRLLRRVALEVMEERNTTTVLPLADYEVLLELGDRGDHAGLWETALMLAVRPDLVHTDVLVGEEPFAGVLGESPRGGNRELGVAALEHAAARVAAAVERAIGMSRSERLLLRDALQAALAALDATAASRATLGREGTPPVLTPSWELHLRALDAGELDDARAAAESKRRDLAS